MEHLLTNITGVDLALYFALLFTYIWSSSIKPDIAEELDTESAD